MKKYLTEFPHLIREFHFEKNKDLKPHQLTHGSDRKVWWKCSKDKSHEWEASISHRTNGRGCPYCSGHKSNKKIRDIKLKRKGWMMLDEYKNNSTKSNFKCLRCGQIVTSTFARIVSAHKRCQCVIYEDKYQQWVLEAKRRGGTLLTPYFIGGRQTKYLWRCKEDHQWESSVASVIGQGSWCNECRGVRQRTFKELKDVVRERGGTLITQKYLGSEGSYEFECNLGHYFKNRYRKIVDLGQWCGICSKGNKSEEMVRCAMEQIFGVAFPKKRPGWLKNSRNNQMELDGYNDSLKIAFEYQGIQHFKTKGFFYDSELAENKREQLLKQRVEDDMIKVDLCKSKGVSLFILSYKDSHEDFLEIVKRQSILFNIDIRNYDFKSPIDFSKSYIKDDRLSELRELLSRKNITLISDKWLTVNTRYQLKCNVCSREWSAQGNAFFNSRSVAGCRKCSHKAKSEKQKLGMDALIQYANKKGGRVLSKEYIKRAFVYEFECEKGHKFKQNFNNMLHRDQFCPYCEGRTVRKSVKL